jgi:hypothetical protein
LVEKSVGHRKRADQATDAQGYSEEASKEKCNI